MADEPDLRRLHPRLTTTEITTWQRPFVPELTPVINPQVRDGLVTRPWLDWARRLTLLVSSLADGGGGTGGGTPGPHAPSHSAGSTDPVTVTNLAGYPGGSTNFLRADATFAPPPGAGPGGGMDLDYLGGYAPATYNDGDIVVGADGIAYMCVKDGTTTAPEPWPGGGVKPHHATHEPGGGDEILHINAARITSGLVTQARLGSGSTGAGTKVLVDNQTWQTPAPAVDTTPIGASFMWFGNVAPANYVLCWGTALSRTTYATLFSIIGTAYGAGDGSTTFNVPNLIGRFPLGQTSAGALNALGVSGGMLDHYHEVSLAASGTHSHTAPAHQHTTDIHAHAAGSLGVASHNHGGVVGGNTGAGGDHAHPFGATTSGPSSNTGADAGGSFSAATNFHTHGFAGNTDPGGSHTHGFSAGIPADAPAVTGGTANAGGGVTSVGGGTATTVDGSHIHTGVTTVNNPPFLTVNFIIKVL